MIVQNGEKRTPSAARGMRPAGERVILRGRFFDPERPSR